MIQPSPFVVKAENGPAPPAPAPSPGPVDWPSLKARIVAGLDVAAEYAALGVEFVGAAKPSGWRECRAVGRSGNPDEVPSAAVNVATGVYKDSGDGGAVMGLLDFALRHGDFGRWVDVLRHYAAKAGVDLPSLKVKGGGRIEEAHYDYRDAAGAVRYRVWRYRLPNGKKTFSQHPPDGRGGWRHGPGCMDGVTPIPYRLPEILASAEARDPLWIVEGEKDAIRLAAEGLSATTSHGGVGMTDATWPRFDPSWFAGRTCYVLPDNDDAGRAHARKVAAWLHGAGGSPAIVELPGLPAKGDVSDWLDAGHSVEELGELAYRAAPFSPAPPPAAAAGPSVNGFHGPDEPSGPGDAGGPDPDPSPREADDDPHRLARLFLTRRYSHAEGLTLRYWLERWHRWDGAAWRVVPDAEVAAELTTGIKAEFDRIAREDGGRPKPVTTKGVSNAMQALKALALLSSRECARQPAWLGGRGPDPLACVAAGNGVLDLAALVAGRPGLRAPTPRYFAANALDFPFDPGAREPAEWLRFLDSLWDDDPESIESLREWFGYLLTPDTRQQKMLMLIGPRRSGKGTIGRILEALVGPANVAAPTLSGLATNFGLAPLIGKSVALIPDARLSGRADSQVIIERLLSISGQDPQTIDRKHREDWTGYLTTRFVVASNELPRLGDSSGALPGRVILLRLTRTFFGREDMGLFDRLAAELPGILRWAIAGWESLRARGRFLQPRSGQELLDDLDELSSPIAAFVAECCLTGPEYRAPVQELYGKWKSWCESNGREKPGDVAGFGRNLRAVLPKLSTSQPREGGKRQRVLVGIAPRDSPEEDSIPF